MDWVITTNFITYKRTINMGFRPSMRSRWLDIGQVLLLGVYGPRQSHTK